MGGRWVAEIKVWYGKAGPGRECCLTCFAFSISLYTKPEIFRRTCHIDVWTGLRFLEITLMVLDCMTPAQYTG